MDTFDPETITVEQIVQAFLGPAKFARAIGVTPEHGSTMRQRKSIPMSYWDRLIEVAAEKGFKGLDYAALVAASRNSKRQLSEPSKRTGRALAADAAARDAVA